MLPRPDFSFFFFNDRAPPEIYTLPLHDALPIWALAAGVPMGRFARAALPGQAVAFGTSSSLAALPALIDGAERVLRLPPAVAGFVLPLAASTLDRKSTRLNSSHSQISYAVFCLK